MVIFLDNGRLITSKGVLDNKCLKQLLIPQLFNDISKHIFEILIQQNSLAFISSFSLVSKQWKLFFESKVDIFISQIFFQIKKKYPYVTERLKNYYLNPEEKEFSNQGFKFLDQTQKLCPLSFATLLSYDSPLFQPEDLTLRILHRYQWILEETVNSQNKAIRKIAYDSLSILKSSICASSQDQRLNFIQNDFSKLYLGGKSKLLHSSSQKVILATLNQFQVIENWKLILDIMTYYGIQFHELTAIFKKNRELTLAIVKLNGFDLQYADETLMRDRDIVLEAVKQNGNALRYADASLKRDREIVLEAIKHKDFDILCADESFKRDREMMLEAVKKNGKAFEYIDASLKQDREIVLEAVKQNGYLFEYASQVLKKDRDFILTVIPYSATAIQFADPSLLNDKEFVLKAIDMDYHVFQYLDSNFRWQHNTLLLEAVDQISSKLLN